MKYLFTSILVFACSSIYAQVKELTGTIIGTTYSVEYGTGAKSTTVNTKEMAFDNNLGTMFASYERSYTWVGLDLGKKHVIKKVAFASREYYPNRMTLGVFEGANNEDFTDAVPLYIIKSEPADNELVTVNVNVSRGFRYVRYVGPSDVRCNVAEIKFYGEEGEGDDSQFYTITNLPTVSIHTVGAEEVTSKDYYLQGIINIISEEGKNIFTDSLNIKGRGNASWLYDKKPYRLKLFNKAHLLNMPAKAKNWVLINNWGDKTLIRNCLAFQISRCLQMEYTPACTMVDVMLNGEYKGTYQLCDKIDIRKHRVDIVEMDSTDNKSPEVTGGYVIEIDGYASQEKSWFTASNYDIPVTIKYPQDDEITTEQYNYIKTYFNRMASRVASSLYTNETYGYHKYLDKASFLKHLLVGELSGNTDTYHSVYMYKDRDSAKIYTGPVWDFDLAFDNDQRTHPIIGNTDFLFRGNGTCTGNMREFANRIINSSTEELTHIWSKARYDNGLTNKTFGLHIDSLTNLIAESQVLNFMRWPILSTKVHQNYQALGSYDAEVKTIRTYLTYRFPWMDSKVGLTPVGIDDIEIKETCIQPSDNGINIDGLAGNATVSVYDTSGLLISNTEISGNDTDIALSPGVYIVKLETKGKIIRKKIIVR